MRLTSSRTTLAIGASIMAMGLAMPALAQATTDTVPGVSLPGVATIPGATPIDSGVTSVGTPAATANVIDVASGTIEQRVVGEEGGATTDAASLTNNGSTSIRARATATNTDGQAIANAALVDGIFQNIAGPYTGVSAAFVNSGTLTIGASASATGTTGPGEGDAFGARATSSAIGGVHQEAVIEGNQTGTTMVTHTNSGTFNFSSSATASATDSAFATSELEEAVFMRAQGNGSGSVSATTTLTNSGTMTAASTATAISSALDAVATAGAGGGEHGLFHIRSAVNGTGVDVGSASLVNNAGRSITVTSTATATALGNATATALGGDGFSTAEDTKGTVILVQAQASGSDEGTANSTITNAGTVSATFTSRATSTGEEGSASATTISNGTIRQIVEAGGPESFVGRVGTATLTNASGGTISIATAATANALGAASANAQLGAAVLQNGEIIGVSNVNFNNAGTFTAGSTATATGSTADVEAGATGVLQRGISIGGFNASLANTGNFSVSSSASATGGVGSAATADALGYQVVSEPMALTVSNSSNFTVNAAATSSQTSAANAIGMSFLANIDPTTLPPEEGGGGNGEGGGGQGGNPGNGGEEEEPDDPWEGWTNRISGSAANSGTLAVNATATGGEGLSTASATGVEFESAVNVATFTNTGTIRATAITNGGNAQATGIVVRDFFTSPALPGEADRMTIANNGGTIIARISNDGGATFQHGTALDTVLAPNPVDIRFTGNSNVYGNIQISADDTITIASGVTTLDGIINPEAPMVESIGVFAAGPIGALTGSLTVANGATLYLVDQPGGNTAYDGPAGVNVDSFTLASGSTLRLQLPSSTLQAAAQAAFPYVNANAVTLTGANLVLVVNTPNGLFDDAYVFNDVIDGVTRTGQFANVTTNTGSVLLAPSATYDASANVDLRIDRVAFDGVAGLTGNQAAAAGAIETVYSPTQTGDFGSLLANLFLIDDAGEYADAMNQLSGAQYAGHMQALRNNSLQVSTLVSDQIDCAVNNGGIKECQDNAGGLRLWAVGGINDARVRSDGNGIGHSSDGAHALLGVDYTISNFTFGAFGGYREVQSEFDLYGGKVNTDGFQIGLLAGFDSGDFYLRANGSYSKLNGDATRAVGILTTAGTIASEPDFRVTSFYAEAGGRLPVGQTWVTPFVGLEYTKVKMNGFTETGVGGANLAFDSQSENDTAFLAGVKWAGKLGIVVPEAKVAYRHDDNAAFGTLQRFADAPGNALFSTVSPQSDKDTVMAGLSLAALFNDKVTGRIGYQGRFGSDLRDNAFYGSLVITFGGGR
jgi:trimeric autotransporter adhesin